MVAALADGRSGVLAQEVLNDHAVSGEQARLLGPRALLGSKARTLVREQPLLALEPPAKAHQRAVGADDAVTGHDDRDGVSPVRKSDRTHCLGIPDSLGETAVAQGLAERDRDECPPDALLEDRALESQRQIEDAPRA